MLDEVLHGGLNLATLQAITGTEVNKENLKHIKSA
jgi:hypothetical protein